MSNNTISSIFIVAFLSTLVIVGIVLQRRVKTASNFLTGGGNVGVILAAGMFCATFLSGSSIVGYTGYLYGSGWTGFTSILGTAVSLFIVGAVLVKRIRPHAGRGMETIADLLADRFGSQFVRGFSAVMMILLYIIFTGAETIGIAKVLSSFLGWNYYVAVLVAVGFTIAYIVLGGMYTVAVNDTICGFLGIGGILVLAIVCVAHWGGIGPMNTQLAAVDPNLLKTFANPLAIILVASNTAVWGIGNSSHPVFLAQTFSAKSSKSVLKSMAISAIAIFVFYFSTMILGSSARILVPGLADVDLAFPKLVDYMVHPVIGAIMLTAVIALIISTIDSCLLTAGSALGNDLIAKTFGIWKDDERKRLLLVRVGVVAVALLGMVLALIFNSSTVLIFQMFNFGASGAVFWVPIVFGLCWKKANRQGATASMVGGVAAYLIWFFTAYNTTGLHPVLPGTIVALLLMVIVSLSTAPTPKETLKHYFPDGAKLG
ncbi:MAG: hypothetical protein LBN26_00375 [Christensenellaceae bacterium]|jgi:sodium/pantothenate symporter|nr:hypothetical protein [Christensenellaceae bacterium]